MSQYSNWTACKLHANTPSGGVMTTLFLSKRQKWGYPIITQQYLITSLCSVNQWWELLSAGTWCFWRTCTDVQDRLPLSLPAHPPLGSQGPCSVSLFRRKTRYPIYRYIKHISPKLCDSTQQQQQQQWQWQRISARDGSIVLAWKSIIHYHNCLRTGPVRWQPPITAAAHLVLNLLLATEIMFTTITEKRREKKGNFPELLPLPCNGTQWQVFVLVLIVDVFFFPLPHIFGKACSINQWHRCEQCSLEPSGQQAQRKIAKMHSDLHRNSAENKLLLFLDYSKQTPV